MRWPHLSLTSLGFVILACSVVQAKGGHHQPLPPQAQQIVAAVRAAAQARDLSRLRGLMADFFIHSFGDEYTREAAMRSWKEAPQPLGDLVKILDRGCVLERACHRVEDGQPLPNGSCLTCGRTGKLAAGFEDAGDGWRFVYFVGGD
jgi:hypothetical protein